jgi:hypothetical protein
VNKDNETMIFSFMGSLSKSKNSTPLYPSRPTQNEARKANRLRYFQSARGLVLQQS